MDEPAPDTSSVSTSLELLRRARQGDRTALDQLLRRLRVSLRSWARGRLPRWARAGKDTEDLVQDVLVNTLTRLDDFEPRRRRALQAYLRSAIRNRIRDEIRSVHRRGRAAELDSDIPATVSVLDDAIERENLTRYRRGLSRLEPEDRELIVARLELGYTYEQVALATGRPTSDAARVAVRRALLKLAREMSQ